MIQFIQDDRNSQRQRKRPEPAPRSSENHFLDTRKEKNRDVRVKVFNEKILWPFCFFLSISIYDDDWLESRFCLPELVPKLCRHRSISATRALDRKRERIYLLRPTHVSPPLCFKGRCRSLHYSWSNTVRRSSVPRKERQSETDIVPIVGIETHGFQAT